MPLLTFDVSTAVANRKTCHHWVQRDPGQKRHRKVSISFREMMASYIISGEIYEGLILGWHSMAWVVAY